MLKKSFPCYLIKLLYHTKALKVKLQNYLENDNSINVIEKKIKENTDQDLEEGKLLKHSLQSALERKRFKLTRLLTLRLMKTLFPMNYIPSCRTNNLNKPMLCLKHIQVIRPKPWDVVS